MRSSAGHGQQAGPIAEVACRLSDPGSRAGPLGLHNQRVNALLSQTVPVIGSTTTTARKSRNR